MSLRAVLVATAALFALTELHASAAAVSIQAGNIFIADSSGEQKQLTASGRDSSPTLSPDGRWIVFVRTVAGKKIASGADESDPAELWQVRADGKESTLLLRTRASEKVENLIAAFDDLQFSADGRLVYFVTPAWATSGAVHVVDTTNRKERFVLAGHNLEVVRSGEYRDHLLLQQHRYFVGGGSYDWFFLFSPDGKEIGPVGEDPSNFKETNAAR